MSGQPKAPIWLAVWAVSLGLVGLAAWRAGMLEQFGFGRPGAAGGQRPVAGGGGPAGGREGGDPMGMNRSFTAPAGLVLCVVAALGAPSAAPLV